MILGLGTIAQADNQKIYRQIKRNKPDINEQLAKDLSHIISKMSKKHSVPANLYTAILMQESGYDLNAVNLSCGIAFAGDKSHTELCVIKDAGISQINYKTINDWKFNTSRLLTDLNYSVEAGAKVLADIKKRYSKNDPEFWTRYNASSPEKRATYKKLVSRWR